MCMLRKTNGLRNGRLLTLQEQRARVSEAEQVKDASS